MAIFLITGEPTAKVEGDQIAVSFPSGNDSVTIAIEPHQAKALCHELREVAFEVITARRKASAQIVAFPSERVRRA